MSTTLYRANIGRIQTIPNTLVVFHPLVYRLCGQSCKKSVKIKGNTTSSRLVKVEFVPIIRVEYKLSVETKTLLATPLGFVKNAATVR
jgi:hypothetical protein